MSSLVVSLTSRVHTPYMRTHPPQRCITHTRTSILPTYLGAPTHTRTSILPTCLGAPTHTLTSILSDSSSDTQLIHAHPFSRSCSSSGTQLMHSHPFSLFYSSLGTQPTRRSSRRSGWRRHQQQCIASWMTCRLALQRSRTQRWRHWSSSRCVYVCVCVVMCMYERVFV